MTKKRKQNIKVMFLRGLLQSFFIVVVLLGVGLLGYKTTMKLWMVEEKVSKVTKAPEPSSQPIAPASVDDIAKNLIYCYDKEDGKITKLVLEIFHCEKKQLTYITIPLDTQFTMTDQLYQRLIVVEPAIPQILRLSSMTRYFKKDAVFDYGALLLSDMLKLEISFYTVIPEELYSSIFSDQLLAQDSQQTGEKVQVEVFSVDYLMFLQEIQTKEDLKAYIEKLYKSLISNLSLDDKMKYLDSLWNTPRDNINFERIPGNTHNSGFIPDDSKIRERLKDLTAY